MTEAIAKRIVVYREATGPYATEEDLLKVKGIEYDTININRESVHVEVNRGDDV